MSKKNKLYEIGCGFCYRGVALVSAESVHEANQYIASFKKSDPDNALDSWGYCYVGEMDVIPNLYSNEKGIVYRGIYYYG